MTQKIFDHCGVSLCCSLALHLLIVILLFEMGLGRGESVAAISQHSVSAYLAMSSPQRLLHARSLDPPVSKVTLDISTNKRAKKDNLRISQSTIRLAQLQRPSSRESATVLSSPLSSKEVRALTQYLYQRIAKHAHYPRLPLKHHRQYSVLLRFTIYPDGHIDNLTTVGSSGLFMLDQSAMQAAKQSAPFSQVSHWLHRPEHFILRINFI